MTRTDARTTECLRWLTAGARVEIYACSMLVCSEPGLQWHLLIMLTSYAS